MTNTKDWKPNLEDCPPSVLRTLLAFADAGSVSKAAAALELDQPIVSRRLKAFTGRPGEAILERDGAGRLRLTERGTAVLPTLRATVAQYADLLANLRGRERAVEVVRIAMGSFAAHLYLPRVLVEVERQNAWRLETTLTRGRDRIAGVADGRFDFALVTHEADDIARLAGDRSLNIELLARHAVAAIADPTTGPGNELAAWPADRPLTADKLSRWPLVGLDDQSGLCRKLQRQLQGRPLTLAHTHQPGGWTLGREYARQKLGVALMPVPLLAPQDRRDFVVRHLSSTFAIEVFLGSHKRQPTKIQVDAARIFRNLATHDAGKET